MPATFFFRDIASTLGGAGQRALAQKRGRTSVTLVTATTAGGTSIQATLTSGGQALAWFTEPIAEDVTIAGNINVNIRGRESATSVNAGRGIQIDRCDAAGNVLSSIAVAQTVAAASEYTTTDAAASATVTPTSTLVAAGERIRVLLLVRPVGGTMAVGTVTLSTNGPTANSAGDTYITFAENVRTGDQLDVPYYEIRGGNAYRG